MFDFNIQFSKIQKYFDRECKKIVALTCKGFAQRAKFHSSQRGGNQTKVRRGEGVSPRR